MVDSMNAVFEMVGSIFVQHWYEILFAVMTFSAFTFLSSWCLRKLQFDNLRDSRKKDGE